MQGHSRLLPKSIFINPCDYIEINRLTGILKHINIISVWNDTLTTIKGVERGMLVDRWYQLHTQVFISSLFSSSWSVSMQMKVHCISLDQLDKPCGIKQPEVEHFRWRFGIALYDYLNDLSDRATVVQFVLKSFYCVTAVICFWLVSVVPAFLLTFKTKPAFAQVPFQVVTV